MRDDQLQIKVQLYNYLSQIRRALCSDHKFRIAYVPQITSTDQNIRLLFLNGLHATDYLYKPEHSVAPLVPTTNAIEHQLCGAFYKDLQLVISSRMPTAENLPYYCPMSVEKATTDSTPAALEVNTTGL